MAIPDESGLTGIRPFHGRTARPIAVTARYDKRVHRVVIGLSSGIDVAFPPHNAQGLETAKASDLDTIVISPSGLGLHFPKLDADLYLPAVLEGVLGSRGWSPARATPVGTEPRGETGRG
jgi:hypothetical protein